jgi:hypothetical protein
MSESAIRAEIKSIMEAVSGSGVVHDHERYSRSMAEFLSLMTSAGKVNGWTISRKSTAAERVVYPSVDREHVYAISGIFELDDENTSETVFQGLIDSYCAAFHAKSTLNGQAIKSGPMIVEDVDTEEYGKRLFHVCELSLKVTDREFY